MKPHTLSVAALGLALIPLLATDAATAASGNTPCKQTARQMLNACRFDLRDDLRVAVANCINLAEADDRRDCLREARAVRSEDAETCSDQFQARRQACTALNESRYDLDPLLDPAISFVNPDEVSAADANPFVSIVSGHTFVLRTGDEAEETVIVHVTDQTREIQGVDCRVVVDAVVVAEEDDEDGGIDYVPVEVTDDWFAQDDQGNVYYCGEIARNYEDGQLVDLDGSFEAGQDSAKAGVLILAAPDVGQIHRQEFALGEAEDIVEYRDLAASPLEENPKFPCAGSCLQTFDSAPLDPASTEFKYYLPGVGFVHAESMEDGALTGELEELVCVGPSLDVLWEATCEIEDPEALLSALCKLSPDAFCEDDGA